MNIKRREFSAALLEAGAAVGTGLGALSLAPAAQAQGGPIEGTHYVRLSQPLPASGGGKIDVIEFFWYGCPHCNAFEPALEPWIKQLPADVSFRRAPVAFSQEPFVAHQRIFYALESMGALAGMHRKVFYAIHSERMRLDRPAEISAFMAKNGLDATKFMEAYDSFAVQTKSRQAAQLSAAYKIDGVPAIGIQGRYFTSGPLAGSNEKSLAVADFLIERVRKGG